MRDQDTHNINETPETTPAENHEESVTTSGHTEDEYNALLDKYQRLQAEFINFKNRTEGEKKDFATFANKGLIYDLLPTVDSLHNAIKSIPEDLTDHAWIAGFHQFAKQFQGFLQNQDMEVMTIVPKETAFDPELHEAIASEPSEGFEGIILETYQEGYMLKGKVLRTAKVKVGA